MAARPKRSWLFAPGNDARKVGKALQAGADCVILDLEDAVALDAKPAARTQVKAVLDELGDGAAPPAYVRINDWSTGMTAADIRAVMSPGLAGVLLPKAESAEVVRHVDHLVSEEEARIGRDRGTTDLVALIESAAGLVHADAVAGACARLSCLAFGAGDLCGDLGIPTANAGPHIEHGKIRVVWASRAAGLERPIDTVFFDLTDPAGLRADCEHAKALGFQGKAVIHPNQIAVVNELLAPSPAEIALARKIVAAFEAAEAGGVAAIRVEGKLIDYAMVKSARKMLETADALAALAASGADRPSGGLSG